MSKYKPLSDRLAGSTACEWRVSFAELAAMLGLALPKAARSGRNWWANEPAKSHSRAWIVRAGRRATSIPPPGGWCSGVLSLPTLRGRRCKPRRSRRRGDPARPGATPVPRAMHKQRDGRSDLHRSATFV